MRELMSTEILENYKMNILVVPHDNAETCHSKEKSLE